MVLSENLKNLGRFNYLPKLIKQCFILLIVIFSLKSNAQNIIRVNLDIKKGNSNFTIGEIPSILINTTKDLSNNMVFIRGVNFQPDYYEYQLYKSDKLNFSDFRKLQKLKIDTINWSFDQQIIVNSWQDTKFKYLQVDINNNNRLDDDIIYSFEKSKKDSIVSNLPELKVSFKYNDNGVIKDGSMNLILKNMQA